MNWQRGLLRVWLLFSVVWVLGFSIYAATNWDTLVSTNTYEITGPNGQKHKLSGPAGISRDDIIVFVQLSDAQRRPELEQIATKLRAADASKNAVEARRLAALYAKTRDEPISFPDNRNSWVLLYWAIGVPLLIFGTGLAVRWVAQGFRRG